MERVAPDPSGLARAAAALRAGDLVAYPTETYYGLAADAWQPAALERLLELKARDTASPLSLILADESQLDRVVSVVPATARALMDAHWPGPLTLVMPAAPGVPKALIGPQGVGVRRSPHPAAQGLAAALGAPLVATSANRRGASPPLSADEVVAHLPDVDLVVDGGRCAGGAPSTVVAVDAAGTLTVLRAGAVHVD